MGGGGSGGRVLRVQTWSSDASLDRIDELAGCLQRFLFGVPQLSCNRGFLAQAELCPCFLVWMEEPQDVLWGLWACLTTWPVSRLCVTDRVIECLFHQHVQPTTRMTPITSRAQSVSERSGRRFELWPVRHKLSQRCPAVVAACHLKDETINTESRFTQTTGNDASERGADFWPITFAAGSRLSLIHISEPTRPP